MALDISEHTQFTNVRQFGFSPWSARRIVEEVVRGRSPSRIPGDFVVVAEGRNEERQPATLIVTSALAAVPYFTYWSAKEKRLYHGCTVFDVVKQARLPWRWNWRALQSLVYVDHTLFSDALHQDVRATPYGAVLLARDGEFTTHHDDFLTAIFQQQVRCDAPTALAAFDTAFADIAVENPLVSLSAGYDSRALLAWFLGRGIKPTVVTMGNESSTDLIVAKAIAAAFGLEHAVVEMQPAQYLEHAKTIVRLTSGAKKASHWHTYIYSHALGLRPGQVHYVGTNGELARSFYFDKGLVSLLFDGLPFDLTELFWRLKIAVRRKRHRWLAGADRPEFLRDQNELLRNIVDSVRAVPGFLKRLDHFMMAQRVHHFHSCGRALYPADASTRSPFLDFRWIEAIVGLPWREKLGGMHHRRIINQFYPRLLDFPHGANPPMGHRPRFVYWLRHKPEVGFSVFGELIQQTDVVEMLRASTALDILLTRRERETALAQRDGALMELLLTLHYTIEVIREENIPFA